MYTEWRDPYFFPEVVYSEERTDWIENQPFNRCFVHAERGGEPEKVEEVTIPVLSLLDEKWCDLLRGLRPADGRRRPIRGSATTAPAAPTSTTTRTSASSAPSPAKHPYKDTIIELDDIVGRLVAGLEETGQADDTIIFLSSDNGPHMENWPDAALHPVPLRQGLDLGGRHAGAGHRGVAGDDRRRPPAATACSASPTCSRRCSAWRARTSRLPDDRFIDGVDQTSFLLGEDAVSNRKYLYYWLLSTLSARARAASTSS